MSKIMPSAYIIKALGEELIKDNNAALLELVKNSYDADSKKVLIEFIDLGESGYKIIIDDYGHGMTEQDITDKWLIPAFSSKDKQITSPLGRTLLGKKGIGRFSAQILGNEFKMTSKAVNSNAVCVDIDWKIFTKDKYLSELDIDVHEASMDRLSGTKIEITSSNLLEEEWPLSKIDNLVKELRMILTPIEISKISSCAYTTSPEIDYFDIFIKFTNLDNIIEYYKEKNYAFIDGYMKLDSFDVYNVYDYRVFGSINDLGIIDICFESRHLSEMIKDSLNNDIVQDIPIGNIQFDIRIIDRDVKSLEEKQNLFSKRNVSIGRRDMRQLYNQVCGLNIIRGKFALRPYNTGYDWLDLDKSRIQDTSLVGNNQVMGFITIESEEVTGLKEKSARDGIKENKNYDVLVDVISQVVKYASKQRMIIRKNMGYSKKNPHSILSEIDNILNDLDTVKNDLSKNLLTTENQDYLNKTIKTIDDTQKSVSSMISEMGSIITEYEKHITLGKMIDVIIHEQSRALRWFGEIPVKWEILSKLAQRGDYENIVSRIEDYQVVTSEQIQLLAKFKKALDPLAATRRREIKYISPMPIISNLITLFESDLSKYNINFSLDVTNNFKMFIDETDLYTILANLIENSIYWLSKVEKDNKQIKISSYFHNQDSYGLIISDNGPGIDDASLDSKVIFEPGYSTKFEVDKRTGLGLAISGDAAERNDFYLRCRKSDEGAKFTLDREGQNNEFN